MEDKDNVVEMEITEESTPLNNDSDSGSVEKKSKKHKHKSRANGPQMLRQRMIDEEIVARCKAAVITALGKFMLKSMNNPSNTELGIGLLSGRDNLNKSNEREILRKNLSSEDALVADLGEALVPYFVTSSGTIDHTRMFL